MGYHVPIMFPSDLLWESMGKHVFIMFSKDLLWSWARARALRPAGNAENDGNDEVLVFPRLRPRTAAPSCKECGTCENRSTTKFWHREVLALSSSPSYLKNQTSLRERFPKERGGLRFNVISRCSPKTPSTPHACQIYVKCMSNLCQIYVKCTP